MSSSAVRCKTCGLLVPEWPQGWRFLDDGRAFCPDDKGELPFADSGVFGKPANKADVENGRGSSKPGNDSLAPARLAQADPKPTDPEGPKGRGR